MCKYKNGRVRLVFQVKAADIAKSLCQARNGVEKWLSAEGGVEEYMVKTCRAEVKKGQGVGVSGIAACEVLRSFRALNIRLGDLCARVGSQGMGSKAVLPGHKGATSVSRNAMLMSILKLWRSFAVR